MNCNEPIVFFLGLGALLLSGVVLMALLSRFDKKAKAANDSIVEVVYVGPGNPKQKRFGAKGIIYGAGVAGGVRRGADAVYALRVQRDRLLHCEI